MKLLFFLLFLLSIASTTFDDLPPHPCCESVGPCCESAACYITEESKVMPLLIKFKSSLMFPNHLPLLLVVPNPALHHSICPQLNALYSNLMQVLQSQHPTAIVLTINVYSQAMHSEGKEHSNGGAGSSGAGSVGSSGAGSGAGSSEAGCSNSSGGEDDGNDDGIWKSGASSAGGDSSDSSDVDEDDGDKNDGIWKLLPKSLRERLEDLCRPNPKLCNMLICIWESLPEPLRMWLEDKLAADKDDNEGISRFLESLWGWLEEGWFTIGNFSKHFKEILIISAICKAAWAWRYYLFILAGLIFLWKKCVTKKHLKEIYVINTIGEAAWEWRYYLFLLAVLVYLWTKYTTKREIRRRSLRKRPKILKMVRVEGHSRSR